MNPAWSSWGHSLIHSQLKNDQIFNWEWIKECSKRCVYNGLACFEASKMEKTYKRIGYFEYVNKKYENTIKELFFLLIFIQICKKHTKELVFVFC